MDPKQPILLTSQTTEVNQLPDELAEDQLDQVSAGAVDAYLYFDPPPPHKTK